MYIAYNMCCLAIYLMPIPLTPPDDEAGISIPNFSYYHLGLLRLIIMAHLPFLFDYVNLMTMSTYILKLCLV